MQNENFVYVEKSLSDRVDHLETVLPHLARLNEQQALLDLVNRLKSDFQLLSDQELAIKNRADSFEDLLASLSKNMAFDKSLLLVQIGDVKSKADASDEKLSNIEESVKKDIYVLNDHKDSLYNKIQEIKDNLEAHPLSAKNSADIKALLQEFESLKSVVAFHSKVLENCKNSVGIINTNVDKLIQDFSDVKAEIAANKEAITKQKQDLDKQKAEFASYAQGLVVALKEELNVKINAIPQPEKISLDAVKSDFSMQLMPVSFDAKNANLRSVNNEAKIVLLEKKVEQLFLYRSQSELNK